ncbi:hypothetical protein HMPREF9074_08239 [Capnocytophaga sp. oral taxon 329 str. F0087]|nr:hypothetical protein HMPREF9074_08239 [Capnocytophaga sp. oral taxon 329 str. F0087]
MLLVSGGKDTDNLLIRQFVDFVNERKGKAAGSNKLFLSLHP